MNHIEHDDPMKTPPRKKQKVHDNIHAVSYSSGVDITDQREIISPMKDWNMFYDDREDEILYQTWTGDEMTIKDKIHNEIEMFVRGNDDLDRFWTIIGDIETVHTENIDNYKQHQKNKSTITDFTKDDLYGIFNDYFTDDMDTAMEDSKQTVTENQSISETERNQTLRDTERYVLVRDAVNERIKQYNIQQKGETLGGKKTNRKTNRKTKRKTNRKTKRMTRGGTIANDKYLALFKDVGSARKWIETAPNLNIIDTDGYTVLMQAVRFGHTEVVKLLIEAGANLNVQDNDGYTALIWAIIRGYTEVAQLLIGAGADLNVQDNDGYTALIYASIRGDTEVAQLLIGAGADLNVQGEVGYTALIWASYQCHIELAKLLIDADADVNMLTNGGMSAIETASAANCREIVDLLIDARAENYIDYIPVAPLVSQTYNEDPSKIYNGSATYAIPIEDEYSNLPVADYKISVNADAPIADVSIADASTDRHTKSGLLKSALKGTANILHLRNHKKVPVATPTLGGKRKTKKRKGGMPTTKKKKITAQKYHDISQKTIDTYSNLSAAFYDRSLDKMEAATDRIDDQLSRPHGAERRAISPMPDDVVRRTISPIPPSFETKKGGKRKTKKRRTRSKRHSKRKRKHQRK